MNSHEQFLVARDWSTDPYTQEWVEDEIVVASFEDLSKEEVRWVVDAAERESEPHPCNYQGITVESVEDIKEEGGRFLQLRSRSREMGELLRTTPKDELMSGFYYRLALAARRYADEIRHLRKSDLAPNASRLSIDFNPPQVTFDGKAYSVSIDGARLVKALHEAGGEWVSGDALPNRPDRVKKLLPKEIGKLIEGKAGKGHRIPRNRLT